MFHRFELREKVFILFFFLTKLTALASHTEGENHTFMCAVIVLRATVLYCCSLAEPVI